MIEQSPLKKGYSATLKRLLFVPDCSQSLILKRKMQKQRHQQMKNSKIEQKSLERGKKQYREMLDQIVEDLMQKQSIPLSQNRIVQRKHYHGFRISTKNQSLSLEDRFKRRRVNSEHKYTGSAHSSKTPNPNQREASIQKKTHEKNTLSFLNLKPQQVVSQFLQKREREQTMQALKHFKCKDRREAFLRADLLEKMQKNTKKRHIIDLN